MADYASDISTDDYLYIREISITETGGEDRVDFPIKLSLSSSNFHFELARSDGKDLRVAERANGSLVFNMWVASWDSTNRIAAVWFKIPSLLANDTKILYVFWGNASEVSSIEYSIFNPYDKADRLDLSNGYLTATKTTDSISWRSVRSVVGVSSGKWYWEITIYDNTSVCIEVAVGDSGVTLGTDKPGSDPDGYSYRGQDGHKMNNNVSVPYGDLFTQGDVIGVALDMDNGKIWWSKNGVWQGGGNPSTDTNEAYSGLSGTFYAMVSVYYDTKYCTANFGASAFVHTPPTGFENGFFKYIFGISDVDSVGFLFADGFDDVPLNPTKWDSSDINSVSNSKVRINTDGYISASGIPLAGICNWIVEEGVYVNSGVNNTYQAYRPRFYGTENDFGYNYYVEGDYDRQSNLVNSSSWITYNGTQKGLEGGSYSENSIAYYEPTDKVYQSMINRSSYSDYTDSTERQVYGDTRATYFRIYGRNNSAAPYADIDWIVVREFFLTDPYSFDTSNLFVPWEQVNPQSIDWVEYDSDLTNINYYHHSSYGGDPYRLSDNATGSTTDCWYSDYSATTSGIDLIIDFARSADNLVSTDYLHYDSGHVGWKNASKLSNNDEDVWGNDYFQSTTTSGYVCIDFGDDNVAVGCLSVKAHTTAGGMIKNFIFKGSYSNPRYSSDEEWDILYTGTFVNISDWQPIYIVNEKPYRYYKIDILDTYGDALITLQEWGMYEYNPTRKKMIISQIRLLPVVIDSGELYFPRWIKLQGSNELDNWNILIDTKKSYTPFQDYVWGRWGRYSFTNTKGYYRYKLTVSGTWGDANRMAIAEWELVERLDEGYKYRILGGSDNNFNSVWIGENATFDDNFIYISNNVLNVIHNDKLARAETVSGTIMDLNIL